MATAALSQPAVTHAAVPHDALRPRRPRGMRAGLGLALLAHALLIAGLTFSLNWRASDPEGIEAELWTATPQIAAPKAVEPEATPPPPPPRPEPVKPAPPPEPVKAVAPPPPAPDPQIAIERERKAKLERERLKLEEEREERQRRLAEKREAEKKEAEKKEAEKKLADKRKREEAEKAAKAEQQRELADAKKKQAEQAAKEKAAEQRLAAQREANLKRMMGQAEGSSDAAATGTAAKTSGPSAGYAGRIKARIKSNMSFPDTIAGNPAVEVVLKLAPDGTILSSRVAKASGAPEWDAAVLRAIEKTAVLPRDIDGRVPASMLIVYQPKD